MEGQDSLLEPYKRTRKGDPETSLAAAESVTEITAKQEMVLLVLRHFGPATDEEIRIRYAGLRGSTGKTRQSDSGLRTRRNELRRRGLVRDSGEKRRLVSGRMAIVWEAPDGQ